MLPFVLLMLAAGPAPEKPIEDALPPNAVARLGSDRFRSDYLISDLAVSYDGMRITGPSFREYFTVWDSTTGRVVCRCGPNPAAVVATAFSPDGRTIAAATWDPRNDKKWPVVLFDAVTGHESGRLAGSLGGCEWVGFAGDHLLMTGGKDHLFRVWDLRAAAEIRQFPRPGPNYPKPAAVSPDGRLFACMDNDTGQSHPLQVYEISTGRQLLNVDLSYPGWEIAFAPDSRSLALRASEVRWYELPSGREAKRWNVENDRNAGILACSNDGPFLLNGTESGLAVYHVAAGKPVDLLPRQPVCVAGLSVGNSAIFVAGNGQRIGVWDLRTGRPRHPANPGHTQMITTVALAPDGKAFTADTEAARWWEASREIHKWRMPEWAESGAISPDRRTFAVGCDMRVDTAIHLLDAATGRQIGQLSNPRRRSGELIFSPDGRTLMETGDRLRAWTVPRRRLSWERGDDDWSPPVVAYSPDGRILFTGDHYGVIREHKLTSGKITRVFEGHPQFMDPDALGWDIQPPPGHTANMTALAVSPDGHRLVSAATDNTIRIWEVKTGKECSLLERATDCSAPDQFPLAFSPNGSLLAAPGQTGDRRHLIDLWDIRAVKRFATFDGHRGAVTAIAFSPDGRRLISGGADTLGYIWEVPAVPREPATTLDATRIANLWADLADADAAKAFRAIGIWVTAPEIVAKEFRRLKLSDMPVDAECVNRLVADLDSDQYAVREKASKDIRALGAGAGKHLRRALEKNPLPEAKRRIEALLAACPDEDLRGPRAVEVLEAVGNPAARTLLEEWAKADPAGATSTEAAAALARMRRR